MKWITLWELVVFVFKIKPSIFFDLNTFLIYHSSEKGGDYGYICYTSSSFEHLVDENLLHDRGCEILVQRQKTHAFFAPVWGKAGYSVISKVITLLFFLPSPPRWSPWIAEMYNQNFGFKQNGNPVWQGPERVTL